MTLADRTPSPRLFDRIRPSHVGLAVVLVAIVVLVALDDTGHLGWVVRPLTRVPYGDKCGHFVIFGTLAFFAARAFPTPRAAGAVPLAVLGLLALAGLEELSQAFVPTRHCDIWDFAADTAGMAVFSALAAVLPRRLTVR
jgi:VanZ family protein